MKPVVEQLAPVSTGRRWWQKIVRAASLLALVILSAYVTLPWWLPAGFVGDRIAGDLASSMGVPVEVGSMSISWAGVELKDIVIDPDNGFGRGPLVEIKSIAAPFEPLKMLFGKRLEWVEIIQPRFRVAWDDDGKPVVGKKGELVCTAPFPSMPVGFWGDEDGSRYRESYFDMFPGVWRHGDWIRITPSGGAVIYGRSDATINRYGVRMGTSEIYDVVQSLDEVTDCLVVDLEGLEGESYMPLFVVLATGAVLDDALQQKIRDALREQLSPRHVPDEIVAVPEIPYTLSGKKMELPVRRVLKGRPLERAANPDAMRNPRAIEYFVEVARRRQKG